MFHGLLKKVVGDPNEREIQRLQPLVAEINALEPEMRARSDADLRALTDEFKAIIAERTGDLRARVAEKQAEWEQEQDEERQGQLRLQFEQLDRQLKAREMEVLDELLPRAFAAVREAARRTIGLRHYDVQLIGGIVLHRGKIAEMKTGEGKTLVATLPLYLTSLLGRGAHLVTPNDYLSKFGVQWMGPIYHLLGVSVGVIQSAAADPRLGSFLYDPDYPAADDRYQHLRPVPRREAYLADITYGTNNEFGFDYLRDNMVVDLSQRVQRELYYAIVDEVDNILIDEARTPLIISGPAEESADYYRTFARLVPQLRRGSEEDGSGDYIVDEKAQVVTLTEQGIAKVERALGIDNLYSPQNFHLTPYLDNALRAHALYKRDRDYIVKDGEVIIVDEFTGRLMYGRRYSEGLHQAIEAKEGVRVQRESLTLATITFQNYFRMYHRLAGMTGTAATEAEEFGKIYNLDVTVIPTHLPMIRTDHPDVVYKSQQAKFRAIVREIEELYRIGRPVLVGTIAIETSEYLSDLLKRRGIPHQVLNAKHHEKEAQIIAQAGRSGTVTIATNMAGRGVDILLGGNPEGLARERLRREGYDLTNLDPEVWEKALAEAREECERDRQKVLALGGLHVLGTERHEARRIDNQLRGRSGRQGDPGSSRFYVSLEDDLMRRFGGQSVANIMDRLGLDEDIPIEHDLVSRSIESAQKRVEGYNFDIRKHVLEYDDVVNKQREVIYAQRRKILSEPTMKPTVLRMIEEELTRLVNTFAAGPDREEWDLNALASALTPIFPPDTLPRHFASNGARLSREELLADLIARAHAAYEQKEAQVGSEDMRRIERLVMLQAVDNRWVRHLTDLDALREGIGLRAFGQQDPLVAYKREAHEMYLDLLDEIRHDIVYSIYHAMLMRQPVRPMRAVRPGGDGSGAPQAARAAGQRLGRNDPCWCGSGKKYKYCHLRQDMQGEAAPPAQQRKATAPVAQTSHRKKKRRKR
ncbi:MAG: preprotein translocase subunit SecA [Anaerolineae bacterium]|nr:preprotein translocase subunit SecA [Anaerolineae bacterium]